MGLIHRLFKVSQLRIKTASAGTQLDLASIENSDALRVRELIENRRGAGDFSDPSEKTAALKRRTLSRNEILIAAATSRQFLASLAVAIGAYDQIGNMLGWHFLSLAIDSATTDTGIDWTLLNPAPFVILAMIGFLAIVGTLMYILSSIDLLG